MAQLTEEWKGLREQSETLKQGRHSQKVLAERAQPRNGLAVSARGVRDELQVHGAQPAWQTGLYHGLPMSCSAEWAAGTVLGGRGSEVASRSLGGLTGARAHTQSTANRIQQGSWKRDPAGGCLRLNLLA